MKFSAFPPSAQGSLRNAVINGEFEKLSRKYEDDASTTTNYDSGDAGSTSSDDDDDSDSSWDDDMDELMNWFNGTILQPRASPGLKRTYSMPVIRTIDRPKLIGSLGNKSTSSVILNRIKNCKLEYLQSPKSFTASTSPDQSSSESPEDCIRDIFHKRGVSCTEVKTPDSLFLAVTNEHINAHSLDITVAARQGDLAHLKACFKAGRSLQCCNRHGESIIHIVCRRGSDKILKFLVEKAGVTTMVRDDVGRTPLHDAAWTGSPNFKLVTILLEQFPQMIHVKDTRNHTPLAYVPRQQWGAWCSFLRENQDLLLTAVSR